MIGQGLDLELTRDSFAQRILLRWRLFANRKHNSRVIRQMHCIRLCDLQRGEALMKASFDVWSALIYHKTLIKTAFRVWTRETNPPYELDWDVIEAGGAGLVYTADRGWQTRPGSRGGCCHVWRSSGGRVDENVPSGCFREIQIADASIATVSSSVIGDATRTLPIF